MPNYNYLMGKDTLTIRTKCCINYGVSLEVRVRKSGVVIVVFVIILKILLCYLLLPLAAPFIVFYALCISAWLARRNGQVAFYSELLQIPKDRAF